jgi:hypothetical protein
MTLYPDIRFYIKALISGPDIKAYRIGRPYRVAISFDIRTQKCPDIEILRILGVRISALDCKIINFKKAVKSKFKISYGAPKIMLNSNFGLLEAS